MKYMLLMYTNEAETPKYTPEEYKAVALAWSAFAKEASAAGVLLSSSGLDPVAYATTLRVRDGQVLTTPGPFAETREQLGGCYLIECQDLGEAQRWAAMIPNAASGSIEIRPLWSPKSSG
jgi:hypothetical protein